MRLREMKIDDLGRVVSLYRAANRFATAKDIYLWTKDELIKYPKYHLVIEEKGQVLGAISGIIARQAGVIQDVAVADKSRGQGIGRRLMLALIRRFSTDGIKTIRLWVHWTDARAIPFYYRLGFKLDRFSRTKGIKGVPDNEDILHLEKAL